MSQYKVSIIVNTYNGERYVAKIIETLRPYESDVIEFVLVDDGSKEEDTTAEQFKKAFQNAIIIKESNEGLAAARNKGAAIAQGEFLQFIDIDDSISADKILAQYDFAKKVNADIVYSDWRMMIVDKEKRHMPEKWVKSKSQDDIVASLLKGWWNPFHSYLIKKEVYNKVGGSDKTLVNAQDFDVMVRIAANDYNFVYLSGNYSEYYRYESVTSLARGNRTQYWKDTELVIDNTINLLQEKGDLKKAYKDGAALRLFLVARNVFKIDREWNYKLFKKVLSLNPDFKPKQESTKFKLLYSIVGYMNSEKILSSKVLNKKN